MRGKVWRQCYRDSSIGITPAYAGKREFFTTVLRSSRDHPRLCGEKFLHVFVVFDFRGSPPPMRGKVGLIMGKSKEKGITPAYAGKSDVSVASGVILVDHPRLCGEKAC